MAETVTSIAGRARARLRAVAGRAPALPDLLPMVETALELLGKRTFEGPNPEGLRRKFTVPGAISNGFCDLSAAGFNGIIFDPKTALVKFTPSSMGQQTAEMMPDWRQLNYSKLDSAKGYCAPQGNGLLFRRSGTTSPTAFNGDVEITTSQSPTLAEVEQAGMAQALVLLVCELAAPMLRAQEEATRVTEQ